MLASTKKEPKDEKEDIEVEPEIEEVKPALPEAEFDIEPVEEIDADAFTPISKATAEPEGVGPGKRTL